MFCGNCGKRLPDAAAFCPECGTPTGNAPAFAPPANPADQPAPVPPAHNDPACDLTEGYFGTNDSGAVVAAWVTSISFFKNSVLNRQLAMLLGSPLALCWAALFCQAFFWEPSHGQVRIGVIVLSIITGIVVVSYLIVAATHRWKHEELYLLFSKGVARRYTGETGERLSATFGATTLGGIALGNLTMTGTSLLAASRISEEWAWKSVRKVTYRPGRVGKGYIKLWGGLFGLQGIWLFTSPHNFERVAAVVRHYTKHLEKRVS